MQSEGVYSTSPMTLACGRRGRIDCRGRPHRRWQEAGVGPRAAGPDEERAQRGLVGVVRCHDGLRAAERRAVEPPAEQALALNLISAAGARPAHWTESRRPRHVQVAGRVGCGHHEVADPHEACASGAGDRCHAQSIGPARCMCRRPRGRYSPGTLARAECRPLEHTTPSSCPVACRWVNCGAVRRGSLSSSPASRGAGDPSPLTGRRPKPSAGSGALRSDARGAFKESPDGRKRGTEPRARRHDGETSLRRSAPEGRGYCHPRGQRDGGAGGGGADSMGSRPARTGEASVREDTAGSGYGIGCGLRATPAGVHVIRGRDVEWQPAVDLNCLALQRAVVALWSSG